MEELIKYVFIGESDQVTYFSLSDVHFTFGCLKEEVIEFIKKEGIYAVTISYTDGFGQDNTLFLRQLYWIRNIRIVVFQLNLDGLEYLPDLEKIFVAENNSEPIDFSNLPKLVEAEFVWTKKRQSIVNCSMLKKLKLYGFKNKDLSDFNKLKNLEYLALVTTRVEIMNGLEKLPLLKTFEMHYNSKITELTTIDNCVNLKEITITHCSKLKNLAILRKCTQIEILEISDCKSVENNEVIFDLINLRILAYVSSCPIISLKKIPQLKHLERFIIYDTNVEDGNMNPLLELKNLSVCVFRNKKHYSMTVEEIESAINN
jgi:Leucine-rich repeat (LRR) protein